MASARESAQASLGDIRDYVNYEGYQKIRDLAQNNYNNSIIFHLYQYLDFAKK